MLAIVNKSNNTIINLYILPKKQDGSSWAIEDITTTTDVEIREVPENAKVGDIVS